jgi:hypothetical protein
LQWPLHAGVAAMPNVGTGAGNVLRPVRCGLCGGASRYIP